MSRQWVGFETLPQHILLLALLCEHARKTFLARGGSHSGTYTLEQAYVGSLGQEGVHKSFLFCYKKDGDNVFLCNDLTVYTQLW